MTDIGKALHALGITEWVLRGEPTSEDEFNQMFRKVTGKNANGTAIESDDTSVWGVTWSEVSSKKTELVNAEPMRLLREERNNKLAETDWWASSDRTMTQAQIDYRQALRDITNSYNNLNDVVWPSKPNVG